MSEFACSDTTRLHNSRLIEFEADDISKLDSYMGLSINWGVIPLLGGQELIKRRMFDPSDTYLDRYSETYPETCPNPSTFL